MNTPDKLRAKLRALQALRGYDAEKMGIWIHATGRTWQRRMKEPETLTVGELLRLEKCFGTSLIDTTLGGTK